MLGDGSHAVAQWWLAQSAQRRHAQGDRQRLTRGGQMVAGLQLLARGSPAVARQGTRRAPVRRGRGPRSVKQLAKLDASACSSIRESRDL